ncbi:MAG: hypothetical protein LBJ94_00515 [Puniceicoccales bacterium]|jgi:hypothetical protein|nr:hypothetical protein [Puniceicoccales bacterium]
MKNFVKDFFVWHGRSRARGFLKKYDIFHISRGEYLRNCRIFEQNFAGIVLGRCVSGVEAKIIQINGLQNIEEAAPLSLGYFGEIVYKRENIWEATGFCGFIDHCDRAWCCGKIEDSIPHGEEYFYPYCIEPVFEELFFVKHAKLIGDRDGKPSLLITLRIPFKLKFLRKFLEKILFSFANGFEKTKKLSHIGIGH